MADASLLYATTSKFNALQRFRIATLIFVSWLAVASAAFYSFEFQPLQTFQHTESTALPYLPEIAALLPVAASGRATIVHLLDEQCDCLRYTRSHLAALQSEPVYQAADHILLSPSIAGTVSARLAINPAERFQQATLQATMRSPLVIIFDTQQKLAYFGPYSLGPACGRAGDVVMPVLNAIQNDEPVPNYELTTRTCICDPAPALLSASSSAGGAAAP